MGIASVYDENPVSRHFEIEGHLARTFNISESSPIRLKEMLALIVAVKLAPPNCNLRVWTDNISNIFGVASGGGRY